MGRFTKNFSHGFKFDGDDIVVEFTRLNRKQTMDIAPAMSNMSGEENFEKNTAALYDVARKVIGNMQSIKGWMVDNEEITIVHPKFDEYFFEEIYFIKLVSTIVSVLIDKSMMNEDDEKKSGSIAPDTSKVSPLKAEISK